MATRARTLDPYANNYHLLLPECHLVFCHRHCTESSRGAIIFAPNRNTVYRHNRIAAAFIVVNEWTTLPIYVVSSNFVILTEMITTP